MNAIETVNGTDYGRIATCKADECRAPILWRENVATGKRVPLDAAPVESDARFVSSPRWHYAILDGERCRSVTAEEWADHDHPIFISHWRTCPAAKQFAGRR